MDRFFTIWVEGTTGGFHHKHATPDKAREEAGRLARLNIGCKVYVMGLVGYYEVPETPVEWHIVIPIKEL